MDAVDTVDAVDRWDGGALIANKIFYLSPIEYFLGEAVGRAKA